MKIIVYPAVFFMLLFLLLLSFEEGRYSNELSTELNEVSATFEEEINNDTSSPPENATEMNVNEKIETAQEQGNTAFDMMKESFYQLIDNCRASIDAFKKYIMSHTKAGANQFATDVSELVYPTKQKTKPN